MIRLGLLGITVLGLSIYAWRDWFKSLCGLVLLMAILERFPILVWAGGALLGWVAGDIMIKDDALKMQIDPLVIDELHIWAGVAGAVFVVAVGYWIRSRRHAAAKKEEVAAE